MSEAKKEEMSGLLPSRLPLHMCRQGRFAKWWGGRCQFLPGEGRKVPAVK